MTRTGYPNAVARLSGGKDYPMLRGTVKFFQRCDGVLVEAEVYGLPRTETGVFAFHIHEGGSCSGEGFLHTGGHFNPGNTQHPRHAGDLPPLWEDFGKAYIMFLTGRFRVGEIIGKTVIIHGEPDDFHSQPSGNAGMKIACGIIRRI